MMSGFPQRLKKSLMKNLDHEMTYNADPEIIAERNRYISTWLGESMVASMSSFDKIFIKKEEYLEVGDVRQSAFGKIF
jgi:actin-related protein